MILLIMLFTTQSLTGEQCGGILDAATNISLSINLLGPAF